MLFFRSCDGCCGGEVGHQGDWCGELNDPETAYVLHFVRADPFIYQDIQTSKTIWQTSMPGLLLEAAIGNGTE